MSLAMLFISIELKIYVPDGLGGKRFKLKTVLIWTMLHSLHTKLLLYIFIILCWNYYFICEFLTADLMDALSDPRAFLSAQEKRLAQMRAMGIEEADIQTKDLQLGATNSITKKDEDKKGSIHRLTSVASSWHSTQSFFRLEMKDAGPNLLFKDLAKKASRHFYLVRKQKGPLWRAISQTYYTPTNQQSFS